MTNFEFILKTKKRIELGNNYTSPKYFELFTDTSDEAVIYVLDDENKRNLVEYLCIHFFGWFAVTELVTVLMQEPIDLDEIRQKLKQIIFLSILLITSKL